MPLGVLIGGGLSEVLGVRPLYLLIGLLISLVSLIGVCHTLISLMKKLSSN